MQKPDCLGQAVRLFRRAGLVCLSVAVNCGGRLEAAIQGFEITGTSRPNAAQRAAAEVGGAAGADRLECQVQSGSIDLCAAT
jgi:hypothetical protein